MSISGNSPVYATSRGEGLSFGTNDVRKSIAIMVDTDAGSGKNRIGTDAFYFEMRNNRLTPSGWEDGLTVMKSKTDITPRVAIDKLLVKMSI